MKKIIALLFMLPIILACGDKNTPDNPPKPNPDPNPPTPPAVVTSPPRVRGFMVQSANGLHAQTIKDLSTLWPIPAVNIVFPTGIKEQQKNQIL